MKTLIVVAIAAVMTLFCNATGAYPDGAPWGAANPAAEQNCASCHFDDKPVHESRVLKIKGLPGRPEPGELYKLEIIFEDPDTVIAGFQLIAQAADSHAGTFISSDAEVEAIGAAIRSTVPISNDERVAWAVGWRAPEVIVLPILFHVAASAANDDASPFGDTVHFRSYKLAME